MLVDTYAMNQFTAAGLRLSSQNMKIRDSRQDVKGRLICVSMQCSNHIDRTRKKHRYHVFSSAQQAWGKVGVDISTNFNM